MHSLPGWYTALLARAATMLRDRFMLSGTMVEPHGSGNPCVVVADHGNSVDSFREADLLTAAPGMSSDNDLSMKLWQAGCRHFIGVGDSLVCHFQCKSTGKVKKNDGRQLCAPPCRGARLAARATASAASVVFES